jgi:hypothetical protein
MFKKGVSILLILIVGSVLLSLSLGLVNLTTKQIETLRERANSLKAFYLADAGIERVLGMMRGVNFESIAFPVSSSLGDGSFEVRCVYNAGSNPNPPSNCTTVLSSCFSPYVCLFSIGKVKESQRAILVNIY